MSPLYIYIDLTKIHVNVVVPFRVMFTMSFETDGVCVVGFADRPKGVESTDGSGLRQRAVPSARCCSWRIPLGQWSRSCGDTQNKQLGDACVRQNELQ